MSIVKVATKQRKDYSVEGAVGMGTLMAIIGASTGKTNELGRALAMGIPGAGLGYTAGGMIKRNRLKHEIKRTLHNKLIALGREYEP